MEYTLRAQQEFLSPFKHLWFINSPSEIPIPSLWFGLFLIYPFSFSSCSKTSRVLCVLSRAARPQSCVCVFVPASLSDHVNPIRGPPPPCSAPLIFFLVWPPLVCLNFSTTWYAVSPVSHNMFLFTRANRTEGNTPPIDLSGSDSNQPDTNHYGSLGLLVFWSHGALQQINASHGPQWEKMSRRGLCSK